MSDNPESTAEQLRLEFHSEGKFLLLLMVYKKYIAYWPLGSRKNSSCFEVRFKLSVCFFVRSSDNAVNPRQKETRFLHISCVVAIVVSAFLAIVFFVVTCRLLYVGVYVRHVWLLSVEELFRVLIKACVFLLTLCVCFDFFFHNAGICFTLNLLCHVCNL